MKAALNLYHKIMDKNLCSRRITIVAAHVKPRETIESVKPQYEQLDLFTDYAEFEKQRKAEAEKREKEYNLQKSVLSIKNRYGKNAMLKGMNLEEGGTTIERNSQIGGHHA